MRPTNETLEVIYANTRFEVECWYYPLKRSYKWEEPDDPAEVEILKVSVEGVDVTELMECIYVASKGLKAVEYKDMIEVLTELCLEKLSSQS